MPLEEQEVGWLDRQIDALRDSLAELLVPALETVLDPLHAWLGNVPPAAWHATAVIFLFVGTIWTVLLGRESVYRGAPGTSRWLDLRLWACVTVLPYLLIYSFF